MTTTKVLAMLTLAAVTLGAAGCRTSAQTGQFLGVLLGTAPVVMIEDHPEDDCHHESHCRPCK